MATKKAALEHNTTDKERLMTEIRTHEQEIHTMEASITKLKQEISAEKQEINKKEREKPKLQQEVSALAHQQDEQRREMTAMEQSYRNNPSGGAQNGSGHILRP